MSNLFQVAKECRVSRSPVSRVINHDPRIGRTRVQKVLVARQKLLIREKQLLDGVP